MESWRGPVPLMALNPEGKETWLPKPAILAREVQIMITKLAKSVVILTALVTMGVFSTSTIADQVRDAGSIDGEVVKRDMQPIPDQEGHVLILSESKGTAANPGGSVDGFSVSIRESLDLSQGSGSQNGYVIFTKGSDEQVVKIHGTVRTVMKEGKPNTTFEGSYEVVAGKGALAESRGSGTYSGYFSTEDAFQVDWQGHKSGPKEAAKK
jgi:hypothetical protein